MFFILYLAVTQDLIKKYHNIIIRILYCCHGVQLLKVVFLVFYRASGERDGARVSSRERLLGGYCRHCGPADPSGAAAGTTVAVLPTQTERQTEQHTHCVFFLHPQRHV